MRKYSGRDGWDYSRERQLINQALIVAGERGCRSVEVTPAFHRSNAHRFYESLGFTKAAIRE